MATLAEKGSADLSVEFTERADPHSFWITNAILVPGGTRELADGIAKHDEVAALTAPEVQQIPEPTPGEVDQTNIDTGVDFRHPALVRQHRGNTGNAFSHDHNRLDQARMCAPA